MIPGPDQTTKGGIVSRKLEEFERWDRERAAEIWERTTLLQPPSTSGVPVDVWADWLRKMYGTKE